MAAVPSPLARTTSSDWRRELCFVLLAGALLVAVLYLTSPSIFESEDYVKLHTNAPYIINDKYAFNDGLFSGWDPSTHQYVKDTREIELINF